MHDPSAATIQEDTEVKEIDISVDTEDEEDDDLDGTNSNVNSANKQQTVPRRYQRAKKKPIDY